MCVPKGCKSAAQDWGGRWTIRTQHRLHLAQEGDGGHPPCTSRLRHQRPAGSAVQGRFAPLVVVLSEALTASLLHTPGSRLRIEQVGGGGLSPTLGGKVHPCLAVGTRRTAPQPNIHRPPVGPQWCLEVHGTIGPPLGGRPFT